MAPPDRSYDRLGTVAPAAVVLLLFALLAVVAGTWPPLVAVESGSMEPHLERGDLVLVTATDRFAPPHAPDAGVVTRATASTYRRLGAPGDVIVFVPPSRDGSPVVHRAAFHVERGENWYDEADPDALPASVDGCETSTTVLLRTPATSRKATPTARTTRRGGLPSSATPGSAARHGSRSRGSDTSDCCWRVSDV